MPYQLGLAIVGAALLVVFATFAYLLVNARALMSLFRRSSDGEIRPGPGRRHSSKRGAAIALILHVVAWAVAGVVWLIMLAGIRATALDSTALERSGIVNGEIGPER
jgi:hypothetical protein